MSANQFFLCDVCRGVRAAWLAGGLLLCTATPLRSQSPAELPQSTEHLIIVMGAAGAEEYEKTFGAWGQGWRELADLRGWELTLIGPHADAETGTADTQAEDAASAADSHRDQLQAAVAAHAADPQGRLWIVLLGHGTYGGGVAKFNLVGKDVSAQELAEWLKPVVGPLVVINCASASAPFMTELASANRVLITATRSGSEINFARFGQYLAQALSDLSADIDHDLEVSLLEAFLAATAETQRFYREEARLSTEHALLDDNGDGVGTSGDFYRGIRPVKQAAAGSAVDGGTAKRMILYSLPEAPQLTAEQAAQRAELETHIDALRQQKSSLSESEYLDRLEPLMLQMAEIYAQAVPAASK